MRPTVGKAVPEVPAKTTVLDNQDEAIELREFWQQGPALLVFLRH